MFLLLSYDLSNHCDVGVVDFLMYHLLAVSEENGYESSIDNDDDISSDEDPDVVNKLEAEVSSSNILPFHPEGTTDWGWS